MRAISPIALTAPVWKTHLAWTEAAGADVVDPMRGVVHLGLNDRQLPFVLAQPTDGRRDDLAPHELFCAAVAASFDATIREIARERSIAIGRLAVIVTGDVDVRGARGERGVMVGFQSMRVEVQLRLGPDDTDSLIAAAEGRCVMLQTLRGALPIELVSGMGD